MRANCERRLALFIRSNEDDGVADGVEKARVEREGVEAYGAVPKNGRPERAPPSANVEGGFHNPT
jgi:hypothetical protein